MRRFISLIGLSLALPSIALAQNAPLAGRPVDYSNIEGRYTIKVRAEPTAVHVEDAITLRIEIVGAGPKQFEPNRKYLKLFPESFEKDFYLLPLTEEDRIDRDKKSWLFVYRLKPKHVKVEAIPDLKLVFYDPDLERFATKYADAISLKVTPRPESPGPDVPMAAVPDSFFEFAGGREVIRGVPSFALSDIQVGLLLALPPILCVAGAWAWRRWFPDELQRARHLRLAAATRTLAALQSDSSDTQAVFCSYLQQRLDFAVEDPTPLEVFAFLKRRGVDLALCGKCQAFFQSCDAVRFTASTSQDSRHLAETAARLIQALEADPCVRA